MKALIVHDSDEVKACFIGQTNKEILEKLKKSEYWEDIVNRVCSNDEDDEDAVKEQDITIEDHIDGYLPHDGDSEDGYTLLETI